MAHLFGVKAKPNQDSTHSLGADLETQPDCLHVCPLSFVSTGSLKIDQPGGFSEADAFPRGSAKRIRIRSVWGSGRETTNLTVTHGPKGGALFHAPRYRGTAVSIGDSLLARHGGYSVFAGVGQELRLATQNPFGPTAFWMMEVENSAPANG